MGRWFEGQCARTRGRAAPGAEAYGTGQVMHSFMLRLSKRSGLCGSVVFSATRTSFVDALPVLFGGRGNKGACVCVCVCVSVCVRKRRRHVEGEGMRDGQKGMYRLRGRCGRGEGTGGGQRNVRARARRAEEMRSGTLAALD